VIPAHFRARCVEVSSAGAGPVRRAGVHFATSCAVARDGLAPRRVVKRP
jgi:hypothetical protein